MFKNDIDIDNIENMEIVNSNKGLPTLYQNIIHKSRYARYLEDKGRREIWQETVGRLMDYLTTKQPVLLKVAVELEEAILNLEVMPSMRLVMSAGEACERDNIAAYNCAAIEAGGSGNNLEVLTEEMVDAGIDTPITIHASSPICFDEIMYVLLCGTGMGFSCERQVIASLPVVGHKLGRSVYQRNNKNFPGVDKDELSIFDRKENKIHVADSKYGWASALRILIVELYNGNFKVTWNLSKIRSAGSPLKTFGGRASGPEPLNDLFIYTVSLFTSNNGNRLNSISVHGLVCKIAEVVVVGGVRRSALISLSNLSDDRMRHAKSGNWWESHPEFALANNSIAYTEKPDIDTYMREMTALIESKAGERGIYNRQAAKVQASKWGRRNQDIDYLVNPCSEIILRSKQVCNLSEVVVRSSDIFEDLKRKVELATILGTIQATLTDFKYLSSKWKKNTEEERLLGVSLTGIMDHPVLNGSASGFDEVGDETLETTLEELRNHARETNKTWSKILGIPESAAITCVKPSGTVSQLVDSASGIHTRHADYYIRRIRMDKKDPMYLFLKDKGVSVEDDVRSPDTTVVFSFPIKAPEGAIRRNDRTAIEQLELWLIYQRHWCEHKPSVTVSVREEEWPDVIAWVWKHFDEVSGISFLPYDGGSYVQAPYEDLTKEAYEAMVAAMPIDIKLDDMKEVRDNTEGSQTLSCTAGGCEI
jgi:ribonucleoside-diphosphate reductase alpha chain